ncbi:MAG: PH domain-containing protein [Candidatus Lokiarchaeota archaeon]|nr:PH domain-containing protein [Candidatus Lokiarchaeota archaeon]
MSETPDAKMRPKDVELLVDIFYQSRTSNVLNYVVGTIIALVGLMYNITTPMDVQYTLFAWITGLAAIIIGTSIVIFTEIVRRQTKYIITSWNVRIYAGFIRKSAKRIFFDDITRIDIEKDEEHERVGTGDLKIYTENADKPAMIWEGIPNPEGIKEVIHRFIETTGKPTPWSHIDKSQPPVI